MRLMTKWSVAVAACLLAIFLAGLGGCATDRPVSNYEIPSEALQDCPEPQVDTKTNAGLARGVRDLRTSLRLCNKDKAILREALEGKD